ncbi:hypothetical protein J3E74DRAFT_406510 [Bipolaris maydis]|nr:hypothetical protein J3E73DRAFT_364892 [Bipolaris maydis]KAJ5060138.1 hypothetical protein J3E74DRAFT_406510 [Bipolaris maydis]
MVTSTKRPGLEVAIHVESRPLQEYDDGDENIPPNTVTKYIKAKSGAEFAASLEALGIVPRDEPMTVPLEDRPEEELTPDELRELVRRMRQTADDEQATATESRTHKRLQADPQVITID